LKESPSPQLAGRGGFTFELTWVVTPNILRLSQLPVFNVPSLRRRQQAAPLRVGNRQWVAVAAVEKPRGLPLRGPDWRRTMSLSRTMAHVNRLGKNRVGRAQKPVARRFHGRPSATKPSSLEVPSPGTVRRT
jgi:hypothetical protein